MLNIKALRDLVQEAIDKGATTVEEVHQAIASRPLELLEQLLPEKTPAKELGELQRKTIGSVYDMIRTVNQAVGELAGSLLEKIDQQVKKTE